MLHSQHPEAQRLDQLIRPVVADFGLDLWGLELAGGAGRGLLRVYIDGPAGVGIDQCAEVSRHLSRLLDVEDPIQGAYTLEVSSPGLERPFFTLDQVRGVVGQTVDVTLVEPLEGRKHFKGILEAVDGEDLCLHVDQHHVRLPWVRVRKARLVVSDWAAATAKPED